MDSRSQFIAMMHSVFLKVAREQQNWCKTQSYIHLILVIGQLSIEQTWFIENDFLSRTAKRDEIW